MKRLILLFGLVFLTGCSLIQNTTDTNVAPQLLVQYPLPIVTQNIARPYMRIEMELYILEDGSVSKVNFIKGSGDPEWDLLAAETIMKWKYSPAHVDHHSVKIWLHQTAVVDYQDPQYVMLAEIIVPTVEEADSIYNALENGKDFDELASLQKQVPNYDINGDLGKVDIRRYPERIRFTLANLNRQGYTRPIKYGDGYVIFKRK